MDLRVFVLSIDDINKTNKLNEINALASDFPNRYEKALSFVKEEDKLRCLGAAILLKRVMGLREEDLSFNEYGKPYVSSSNKSLNKMQDNFFSLSHSGKYVILAVDNTEIGADIERENPEYLDIAAEVFTDEEAAWMHEDMNEYELSRFYRLWTLKESVIKQQGRGLSLPMKSFSVLLLIKSLDKGRESSIGINGEKLYARSICFNDYWLSVCSGNPISGISTEYIR